MQMEQTVAEARLEQVYQHYKKKNHFPESDLVALTQKDRLRIDLLKAESDDKRDKKERSPTGGVSRWVGWIRPSRRPSGSGERASTSGGAAAHAAHAISRPNSSGGSAAGAVTYASLVAGSSGASTSGSVSGRGEPATEAERRIAAREISSDSKTLPRAASLQLPAPVNCSFRDRHPDMCVVRVRRNHLVEDAMDEISRQLKKDLFKPLRVHFIGEEGIDAGGVKKEFFQLLVTELLCPDYGLLVRRRPLLAAASSVCIAAICARVLSIVLVRCSKPSTNRGEAPADIPPRVAHVLVQSLVHEPRQPRRERHAAGDDGLPPAGRGAGPRGV